MTIPADIILRLPDRFFWIGLAVYSLFIFSNIAITGTELSVFVLYLLAIYCRIRNGAGESLPFWVLAPFAGWVGVALISALVNPEPWENLLALRHQYRIFLPLVLLTAINTVSVRRLLEVYLIVVSVFAIYGLLQAYTGIDVLRSTTEKPFHPIFNPETGNPPYRARGMFAGPGTYANQMMMGMLLFLSLALSIRDKARYFWAFGALMAAIGLFASFGRSAWLGTIFGLLVISLRLPRRWSAPIIAGAIGIVVAGSLSLEKGWIPIDLGKWVSSPTLHRLVTASTKDYGNQVRLYLWKAGFESFKDRPLLGASFKNRKNIIPYLKNIPQHLKFLVTVSGFGVDLHSIYMQILHDLGLIGLLFYLSIWTAILSWNTLWIRRAGRKYPLESGILWGASAALTASMFDGLFHDTFFSGNTNATILIYMGLSLYTGCRVRSGLNGNTAHSGSR